ncbi:DUF998 domain-containing protein [Actinoplanes sp. TRM 88003]|uniref:DUF998 domain-containing protein n=1 Tax=Paractinoplanes aksuensis TaxID=2939490 RepID=A0ABT1DJL5_9ACTN|nr:DUF998 domain-containing protein [Actinoplanes aksuensis]MCO8270261.1 DUF998 domain-containing protein [Actinoplanes aksuensis]
MVPLRVGRVLALACVLGALQMIVFTTVAGLTRPGYDPSRNWISQLSLGPGGWLADLNLALCGLWLMIGAVGLRPVFGHRGRWAVGLVAWCGACLVVLAVVPTDAGIGYPPGVPATHTTVGLVHQMVAVVLGVAGTAAAALLGRAARRPYAGMVVALVMAVTFVAASVLVVLDDAGVLPGNPSGLLERVALFAGLAWIAVVALEATINGAPSDSSARAPGRVSESETADAATETAPAASAR